MHIENGSVLVYSTNVASGALIVSMYFGVIAISGILVAAMIEKVGCRVCSLVGAVLSTATIAAIPIATKIEHITLLYGFAAALASGNPNHFSYNDNIEKDVFH